jgi:hypothetical protein
MTQDQAALPAGDALDVLIAEKVMGWTRGKGEWCQHWFDAEGKDLGDDHATPEGAGCGDHYWPDEQWSPSTDIRAAWEVVEKRLSTDGHFAFWPSVDGGMIIAFHGIRTWDSEPVWEVWGDTAPLAICRAALAAIKEER